jgi:transposase
MTARRTDVHRIQELIRLHRLGTGARALARTLKMGRDTVRHYMTALRDAALLDGDAAQLPELEALRVALAAQLAPALPRQQRSSIEDWQPQIADLRERGAGPRPIFDRLRLEHDDFGGSLSAVKRLCLRIDAARGVRAEDVALRVETSPGEVAQVDFGFAGVLFDPERGVKRRAWVFVLVLGHSRHMFAEIVFDQRVETWLELHVHAFQALRGVPRVIVPDNLKAAVIRAAFQVDDAPVLHRSYRELARHYGFKIEPTPPRSPQKKGKVEAGVKYVRRNFLAARDETDVRELRRQLTLWISEIAGRRIHGTTGKRPLEVFEAEEQQALLPLPEKRFERVVWKKAKLHTDSHCQIDGAFYSAPWRFLHQDIWARCTPHSVALFHHDVWLHTHARVARGKRSTVEAHLPERRAPLRHRARSFWEQKAVEIGPDSLDFVRAVFDSDDVLSKLRVVQAVVTHLETFPRARAEAACRRARHFGNFGYGAVKTILRQGLDFEPLPGTSSRDWVKQGRFARSAAEIVHRHLEIPNEGQC